MSIATIPLGQLYILNKDIIEFEGEGFGLDLDISKDGIDITKLHIKGSYANNILKLQSKDNGLSLVYNIPKERVDLNLNGYDILYNTDDEQK